MPQTMIRAYAYALFSGYQEIRAGTSTLKARMRSEPPAVSPEGSDGAPGGAADCGHCLPRMPPLAPPGLCRRSETSMVACCFVTGTLSTVVTNACPFLLWPAGAFAIIWEADTMVEIR